jgi:hypothetical protein
MLCGTVVYGQTTVISNNSSTSTDFVGWNTIPTFDLEIKHEGNYRMIFGTNNLDHFGILSSANQGKVVVSNTAPINGARLTVKADLVNNTNAAVKAVATQVAVSTAGYFAAVAAPDNVGLRGTAANSAAQDNDGVAGYSCSTGSARTFAIFGLLKEDCQGWAGFFNGPSFTTGDMWTPSDVNLKTNIQELTDGMALLDALNPKSYEFDQNFEGLVLPEGLQYGVMAQELATAMPNAVMDVVESNLDEEGTYSFMAVNNHQLLPVLIAAFQERQAEIDQQQELIAQLEEAIEAAEIQMSQISGN